MATSQGESDSGGKGSNIKGSTNASNRWSAADNPFAGYGSDFTPF